MSEDLNAQYRHLLAKQLTMNPETWARLTARGVTESSLLRLDFTYFAPSREAADALKQVLDEQTDYDVAVQSASDEGAQWLVVGSTQSSAISATILDQWVDWMVTAGVHSGCDFDGWGTRIP